MFKLSGRIIDETLEEKVEGRLSLFLDTAIWIDLADSSDRQAIEIKRSLKRLVRERKIFCPITWALTSELLKQELDSALRVAELMETLSLNLSFGIYAEVFSAEVYAYVNNVLAETKAPIPLCEIFVPARAVSSSYFNLDFDDIWSHDDARRMLSLSIKEVAKIKLTDYIVELFQDTDRSSHLIQVTSEQAANWYRSWEDHKGNKSNMNREELTFTVLEYLLPRLLLKTSRLPIEDLSHFVKHVLSLPKDKFGGFASAIIREMPALSNWIDLHAAAGRNPSMKITANHIYDLQMLIVPVAYADVVVARDKWIERLLTADTSLLQSNRTQYLSNLNELEAYLETIA